MFLFMQIGIDIKIPQGFGPCLSKTKNERLDAKRLCPSLVGHLLPFQRIAAALNQPYSSRQSLEVTAKLSIRDEEQSKRPGRFQFD